LIARPNWSVHTGSQADLDTALAAVITAKLQAEFAVQQRDTTLNPVARRSRSAAGTIPEYAQAKAALDNAQRGL
jgi:membrane fusion protein (multidrug efflux system)